MTNEDQDNFDDQDIFHDNSIMIVLNALLSISHWKVKVLIYQVFHWTESFHSRWTLVWTLLIILEGWWWKYDNFMNPVENFAQRVQRLQFIYILHFLWGAPWRTQKNAHLATKVRGLSWSFETNSNFPLIIIHWYL